MKLLKYILPLIPCLVLGDMFINDVVLQSGQATNVTATATNAVSSVTFNGTNYGEGTSIEFVGSAVTVTNGATPVFNFNAGSGTGSGTTTNILGTGNAYVTNGGSAEATIHVPSNLSEYTDDVGYSTGTPLYAESDPIWTAVTDQYYTIIGSDAVYATGTPVYVDTPQSPITGNVDYADYKMTNVSCISFNPTNSDVCSATGNLYYDQDYRTLSFVNADTNIVTQIGQEGHILCKSIIGLSVSNGDALCHLGSEGDRILVGLADAETNRHMIGVATADFDGRDGKATSWGFVRDINTSFWGSNDTLYLSLVPGEITNSPVYTNSSELGYVTRSHITAGSIYVHMHKGEHDPLFQNWLNTNVMSGGDTFATNLIENLANVDSVASPTANHVLTWNGAYWTNAAQVAGTDTGAVQKTGDTMTGDLGITNGYLTVTTTNDLCRIDGCDRIEIGIGASTWNNINSAGIAIGLNANGYNGIAIGNGAGIDGNAEDVAIGQNALGKCSVGGAADSQNMGTAFGYFAKGRYKGVAVGQAANGQYGGLCLGWYGIAHYTNIAIGTYAKAVAGTYRTAIGAYITNDVDSSVAMRGDLYLDGATGTQWRTSFGTGAWEGLYSDGTNLFFRNSTNGIEQITSM